MADELRTWCDGVDALVGHRTLVAGARARWERGGAGYRESAHGGWAGRWIGCWLQPFVHVRPGWMDLALEVLPAGTTGSMRARGDGVDAVGTFTLEGVADGPQLVAKKVYPGHVVRYALHMEDGVARGCWSIPGQGRGLVWLCSAADLPGALVEDVGARARRAPFPLWMLVAPLRVVTVVRHSRLVGAFSGLFPVLDSWLQ